MKRALLALLLLATPVLADPPTPVVQSEAPNDPSKAYDLVFVSEGYGADEAELFFADARAAAAHVASDTAAQPLRDRQPFNYHYVFVPSNQSGAPYAAGAPPSDTAFKAHVAASGWIEADDAAADTAATAAPDVDGVVILIKFATGAPWERSNSDILPAHSGRVRLSRDAGDALVHELGHAIAGLGDEYSEVEGSPPDSELSSIAMFPNLSLDSTGKRWASIEAGAVEGGDRYAHGVWHPEQHCRMNECTSEDFCAVCKAFIAKPRKKAAAATDPKVANGAVTWSAPETPTSWWITVDKNDDHFTSVVERYVEPQTTSWSVADLPPGDYVFLVSAQTMAGGSPVASIEFTVDAAKTVSETKGFIGALFTGR